MANAAAIQVEGLCRRYGRVVALDGLDLEVGTGEVFGLLGRNGAGKTTTIETLVGLQRPDAGLTRVLGLDPHKEGLRLKQRIGVQLQEAVFHPYLKLGEALEFLGAFYPRRVETQRLLTRTGLTGQAGMMYGQLSGGQRRRFLLALALVGEPELLVLDEPTAGLDAHARQDLWTLIREARAEGRTVLLTTHHLDEAESLCDRVAVLHHGRLLAQGTPSEVVGGGHACLEAAFLALTCDASPQEGPR